MVMKNVNFVKGLFLIFFFCMLELMIVFVWILFMNCLIFLLNIFIVWVWKFIL